MEVKVVALVSFVLFCLFIMGLAVFVVVLFHDAWCPHVDMPRSKQHPARCVCRECYTARLRAAVEEAEYKLQQAQIAAAVHEVNSSAPATHVQPESTAGLLIRPPYT